MPTNQKESSNLTIRTYHPSNTLIHDDGKVETFTLIFGEHKQLDNLYGNVRNYDINWSWDIKEAYHEAVMKGQIVCPVD